MKFFLVLCLISTFTLAQDQDFTFDKKAGKSIPNFVGELKLLRGQAFKVNKDGKLPVQVGTRFFKNEVLITEDKSFAKLLIVDDSIVSLGSNSELNFAEFKFATKDNRQIVYSLVKGQIAGLVKRKAEDGDITIRTKMTTMGIRGTKFLVTHQVVNGLEVAQHALLSGSAQVIDEKNQEFDLKKSDKITIVKDEVSQETGHEKKVMSQEEFDGLNAKDQDEEKDFKPFLPYLDINTIPEDSSLYAIVKRRPNSTKDFKSEGFQAPQDNRKKNWKDNLEKLNEQLKENQKKKQ